MPNGLPQQVVLHISLASFIILFQLTHLGSSHIVRQVAQVSQLRFLGRGIGCHFLASQKTQIRSRPRGCRKPHLTGPE
ncbi:uncharacterized protein B0J16DRAFT_326153 [Fusarium flagelliforme]|uniref:uncharacterized protein n=1 Tax=Fusarium flagelliforme TaxID=2675880 RepID=UPI001E8D9D76|nr:uncharacterized protein B0J16DRAFT_326153 [Fusarium flagelliforme]KAH7196557.1 hypothetical protein B0J16DRAFT_326153 [Fusarium flagelliforme]